MSSTTYRVSHLSDPRQFATSLNIARRKTDALDLSGDQATVTVDRPMSITGGIDAAGTIRSTVGVAPLTGQGVEVSHNGLTGAAGIGTITCYDRTGAVYQELDLNASAIKFQIGGVTIGAVDAASFNLVTGMVYKINSVQVVGPRQTGWTADTGTAEKTAHATYTVGSSVAYTAGATLTYSAAYVQAEQTAMATRMAAVEAALAAATTRIGLMETALQGVTRGQKAIKDAQITHGLTGT